MPCRSVMKCPKSSITLYVVGRKQYPFLFLFPHKIFVYRVKMEKKRSSNKIRKQMQYCIEPAFMMGRLQKKEGQICPVLILTISFAVR